MRTVEQLRALAARAWPRRFPGWLAESLDGEPTPLSWPLHPPSERGALAGPDGVAAWATAWQHFSERDDVTLEWITRRWPSMGRQRLPERVSLGPRAVAELSGQAAGWAVACEAVGMLARGWPEAPLADGVSAAARGLVKLRADDVGRLASVLGWLSANPDSGLFERELPVEGVDTKWFERHRSVVEPLADAITGGTGLRRHGVRFRVRDLDPSSPDAADFSVTLEELKLLSVRPARVLISENLTTVATLPPLPETFAVHGMGFSASSLADVGWIRSADVVYWGDLDTYGFQILGQARSALPQVRSVLMDSETLASARALAVTEPRPFKGEIGHLTLAERSTLALIRAEGLRLEQERIPRATAHSAIVEALA